MLGNFEYANPTKLYFGEDSLRYLNIELPKYGQTVMLTYGGGSIKKNGIYDQVVELLKANGKMVVEDPGVMPNPTVEKLYEGCRIAKENQVDLILAVGGGIHGLLSPYHALWSGEIPPLCCECLGCQSGWKER